MAEKEEKKGPLWLFLRFCPELKDVLLPRMSCKMPVKAALHPKAQWSTAAR